MPQNVWVLYLTAPSQKSVWSPRLYYPWNKITSMGAASSIRNNCHTNSKADWSTGSLVAREERPKHGDTFHLQKNAFRLKTDFVDLVYEMAEKQKLSFPSHIFFLPSSFLLNNFIPLSYFLILLFISYSSLPFLLLIRFLPRPCTLFLSLPSPSSARLPLDLRFLIFLLLLLRHIHNTDPYNCKFRAWGIRKVVDTPHCLQSALLHFHLPHYYSK